MSEKGAFQSVNLHRPPPHSTEAEQGVLASMLHSRDAIELAVEKLAPENLYVPSHGSIFAGMAKLHAENKPVELIMLTDYFRDLGQLEAVGGAAFLTNLYTFVPTAANVSYYIDIVRENFVRREIIRKCTELIQRAYDPQEGEETADLLDRVQGEITALAMDNQKQNPVRHVKAAVMEATDNFESAYEHRGRTQGLATGFVDYDRMTSGLGRGEMIVIAARPSMGKTALAMNIAEYVALPRYGANREVVYPGSPVLIFSMETGATRLIRRTICGRAGVPLQKVRDGFFSELDITNLTKSAAHIAESPIWIDDSPGLKLYEFRARCRRAVKQHGIKLIVIDYLQLMKSGSKRAELNRTLEVTEVSAGIKEVGRELNVPVIVLAQLNRNPEQRADGRPRIADLRESGAIEQDADLIALLHRDEYYAQDAMTKAEAAGKADLLIVKQKDGPVGDIALTFLKELTRFEGAARPMYSNDPTQRQDINDDL